MQQYLSFLTIYSCDLIIFRKLLEGLNKVSNLIKPASTTSKFEVTSKQSSEAEELNSRLQPPDYFCPPSYFSWLYPSLLWPPEWNLTKCSISTGLEFSFVTTLFSRKWSFEHFVKRKRKKINAWSLKFCLIYIFISVQT